MFLALKLELFEIGLSESGAASARHDQCKVIVGQRQPSSGIELAIEAAKQTDQAGLTTSRRGPSHWRQR